MSVAILVGIPASLRARVERHVGRRVELRVIPMKRDGPLRLEPPPTHAAKLLETYADLAPSYSDVMVLLLSYAHIPDEVLEIADALKDMGAKLIRPKLNTDGSAGSSDWPARSPRLDKDFQDNLLRAICNVLDTEFPDEADNGGDKEIACSLIRGLAVHSKMGSANHSHEDDLWKTCGRELGPGERARIIKWLMIEFILDRKKNKSMGGTGWVYWIADVEKAKIFCPDLAPYFD